MLAWIDTPQPPLAAMTLRSSGVAPPIRTARELSEMPLLVLGNAAAPVAVTPIRLPSATAFEPLEYTRPVLESKCAPKITPLPVLPEIRLFLTSAAGAERFRPLTF